MAHHESFAFHCVDVSPSPERHTGDLENWTSGSPKVYAVQLTHPTALQNRVVPRDSPGRALH